MHDFFDLSKPIRRRYSTAVWIPLRLWEQEKDGEYNQSGFSDVFDGAHSILVPVDKRELGEQYSWSGDQEARPWAEKDFYKPVDVHAHNAETDIGIRLVLRQTVADQPHSIWHLHPDLIIALGLIREGDVWVRPDEGYAEVVRVRTAPDGSTIAMEIRAEFLRDYLCARRAALRIATYRERTAIVENLDGISIKEGVAQKEVDDGHLDQRATAIDEMGGPFGSSVSVFHMARNDVDGDDDVPVMGPESDHNTDSKSWSFQREGTKRWRVSAEYRRDEWVEPADASPRVRYDRVPSTVTFVVEGDGTRMNADDLDDEDIGRWLWFSPAVVVGLADRRGAKLQWYTRDTGGISTASDPSVHFGINSKGLLTVYARDVARLPEWERRYWAGFNAAPEGGVCSELLAAQVRAEPADTLAPEGYFVKAIRRVNAAWKARYGIELFRAHADAAEIARRVHRFRALNRAGLFAVAKDVARLTADSLDAGAAQAVAPPPKGEKWGSLKSLEKALATMCDANLAHGVMGAIFAAYELRLSDAHLPKSDLQSVIELLRIDEREPAIMQARDMLHAVVAALTEIEMIVRNDHPQQNDSTSENSS